MLKSIQRTCNLALLLGLVTLCPAQTLTLPKDSDANVVRATLSNGMRVVIIPDNLAPVVTVQDNYLVGGDETPSGFPGMAHAQEHMAFRGCYELSADQIAAIFAQLGGDNNADTQQNITQYFETVPAQDLDIALHTDANCMRHVDDAQGQWALERGAIEQEVSRDLSSPIYKFLVQMNHDMFGGTPYEHDPLGTRPSFNATTGAMLKSFEEKWYAPNNSILVITGQVDPQEALATIKKLYGDIPRKQIPARPEVHLQPVKSESITLPSDYPYTISLIAFRMPGTDSPDYAASVVLADVLASQRADIYGLVPAGKALDAGFEAADKYPKAGVAFAYAVIPTTGNPSEIQKSLDAVIAKYAKNGLPPDLVDAAKRSEVASYEFERNSISGLASLWSEALASEGRTSPAQDVEAIERVTVQDVNRLAGQFLVSQNEVMGTLVPKPSGQAVSSKGFGGAEKATPTATKAVPLPAWAQSLTQAMEIPKWDLHPVESTLPNGIQLIVETEHLTPTITVAGEIRHDADLETPPGQDGVSAVLGSLLSYGTKSLDRIAFQKALDDIAANESPGESFSLQVLKQYFDRGMQLLAENELQPALPETAFKVVQQQTSESVAGLLQSPDYHVDRALLVGLLPPKDPQLREPSPKKVDSLTLADVQNYHAKIFRPDLTRIVIIGDISPEDAQKEVQRWFGSWHAQGPRPDVDLPPVPPNHAAASDVSDPTRVQDAVTLSEELPMNRFSPDYYPLQLGNHILGGGFYATRLYRDLREKTGYVYNVSESLNAGRSRTRLTVSYGADAVNVPKARTLIIQDLNAMRTTPPTQGEMQQAVAMLLREIPLEESSESGIADGLLARAVIGLPLDEPVRAAAKYKALSAEEVRDAFNKWVRPSDFVQVVEGPATAK
ncbi:MAG TPA: pitrilysin family protein [Candidatus Sulfotelmatobacter sp.]|nr:pitrilysin family protein [Candidatus Sulfotelmatobacter sp.]